MSNHADEQTTVLNEFEKDLVTIEELERIVAPGIATSPVIVPPGGIIAGGRRS